MTSLQAAAQVEAGIGPGSAEHSSSVNGARSLGTELMELFVLKQADEVSLSVWEKAAHNICMDSNFKSCGFHSQLFI